MRLASRPSNRPLIFGISRPITGPSWVMPPEIARRTIVLTSSSLRAEGRYTCKMAARASSFVASSLRPSVRAWAAVSLRCLIPRATISNTSASLSFLPRPISLFCTSAMMVESTNTLSRSRERRASLRSARKRVRSAVGNFDPSRIEDVGENQCWRVEHPWETPVAKYPWWRRPWLQNRSTAGTMWNLPVLRFSL